MARRVKFGYTVRGYVNYTPRDYADCVAEFDIEIGHYETTNRADDELRLYDRITFNYRSFGTRLDKLIRADDQVGDAGWRDTRGGGIHPLDLPYEFCGGMAVTPADEHLFGHTTSATMDCHYVQRDADVAKLMSFVGRVLDYPDNHMTPAAWKRYDEIVSAYYNMDDFQKMLWCLETRGATLMIPNPRDSYYQMPARESVRPTTENMLAWIAASKRRTDAKFDAAERKHVGLVPLPMDFGG